MRKGIFGVICLSCCFLLLCLRVSKLGRPVLLYVLTLPHSNGWSDLHFGDSASDPFPIPRLAMVHGGYSSLPELCAEDQGLELCPHRRQTDRQQELMVWMINSFVLERDWLFLVLVITRAFGRNSLTE